MSEAVNLVTPVGRLVQGNPFEEVTTNMTGQLLTDKNNNPRVEYFFAIAIPKTDPGFAPMYQQMQGVAAQSWPAGQSNAPGFSWKLIDGDDPAHADKVGFAGCWILRCNGGFAVKVYTTDGAQVVDPKALKRGDYVRAYVSIKGNGNTTNPGIYVNPSMVEIIGYGEEIIGGPSAAEVFGGAPAVMPTGASATPVAGAPLAAGAVVTPAAVPGAVVPPAVVTPAVVTPAVAPAAVVPAADFLTPPPGTPGAVVPPAAAVKTMTAKANGATYEALIAGGWTDATLVQHGLMLP